MPIGCNSGGQHPCALSQIQFKPLGRLNIYCGVGLRHNDENPHSQDPHRSLNSLGKQAEIIINQCCQERLSVESTLAGCPCWILAVCLWSWNWVQAPCVLITNMATSQGSTRREKNPEGKSHEPKDASIRRGRSHEGATNRLFAKHSAPENCFQSQLIETGLTWRFLCLSEGQRVQQAQVWIFLPLTSPRMPAWPASLGWWARFICIKH